VEVELTEHSETVQKNSKDPSAALRRTRRTSAQDRLALPIALRF